MRFLLISILFAIAFCETSVKINKSEVYDLGATITPTFKQIIPLYYEQFISIASCKDAQIDAGKCCDSQLAKQGWIRQDVIRPTAKEIEELKKKFKDETYNYQIIVNDQYKKIILLFPGTRNSVSQLVQEFLGSTLKDYGIDGIKCQKYFLELFESMKERKRQRQEEREQLIREEKNRLLSLSEKELLVEILFELKRIENGIDDVERSICIYSD